MIDKTTHNVYFDDARHMGMIEDNSVDLVVTSPPYPMIEMWDGVFGGMNSSVNSYLSSDPMLAFETMHQELDKVWAECFRVLKNGSFLCINIGNATRTIEGSFSLFDNRYRITKCCVELGFTSLPHIIWKKPTNSPNKFLGSGMLPCVAYVAQGHEYILIFRKGGKREFNSDDLKRLRLNSAYFFEERNVWFSDVWEGITGVRQKLATSRERNAAYPLEIPYRLINMFSIKGDVVLDPFFGIGTTTLAAMVSCRSSIGIEIDHELRESIKIRVNESEKILAELPKKRFEKHLTYINNKSPKLYNDIMRCTVTSPQETKLTIEQIDAINEDLDIEAKLSYEVTYKELNV